MSLFTTYGVQSSVPAKTVVAVIDASLSSAGIIGTAYSLTFVSGQYWETNNNLVSNGSFYRTDKVNLVGNKLYVNSTQFVGYSLQFWNASNQVVGMYAPWFQPGAAGGLALGFVTNVLDVPATATQFAISGTSISYGGQAGQTFAQFQTLVVSDYTDTTTIAIATTVTFFDEYPNGTQIGDVVEVTAPAIINPPATYKIRQLVFEE